MCVMPEGDQTDDKCNIGHVYRNFPCTRVLPDTLVCLSGVRCRLLLDEGPPSRVLQCEKLHVAYARKCATCNQVGNLTETKRAPDLLQSIVGLNVRVRKQSTHESLEVRHTSLDELISQLANLHKICVLLRRLCFGKCRAAFCE